MFLRASSIIGKEIDSVLIIIGGICLALLTLITFLMLYFIIKYSRKETLYQPISKVARFLKLPGQYPL